MTDWADFEDQYVTDYRGSTPSASFTRGGAALDDFFHTVGSRASRPLKDFSGVSPTPFSAFAATGRVAPRAPNAPVFQPAGPPERYQFNLLGEAVAGVAGSAPGQAFLGTQGAQRGGTVPLNFGFGPGLQVATAPVNFQNFATYAREAPLAVMTSILGHKYQQPEEPYAKPAGPTNNDDVFTNMTQADFEGVLDNVIDGVNVVGDVINAPFVAAADWFRRSNAVDRGKGLRDLARTGTAAGTWIARATSIFDDTRFDWQKLAARAEQQGLSQVDMAADLWDVKPEVVQAIFDNPDMPDGELEKLVNEEPYSYDPGVNTIVELSATLAPMLVGAGVVRGSGLVARGIGNIGRIGLGLGAQAAGEARTAAAVSKVASSWVKLEEMGLVGRPIATADALGASTLMRAWRATKTVGLGLEKLNRYSMIAGTGIRLGEWSIKQAASIMGNDEAVATMDRWLWEMPLSNNPGLMLMDAFSVHPLRTAKGIYQGAKREFTARLFGGDDLAVTPAASKRLGSIASMPLDTVQERLLDGLNWDRAMVNRLFGEDGVLDTRDLKNGLLYIAQQVVRQRHEAKLRFLEPEATILERNRAFWTAYGDEATRVLQSALTGRGPDATAIADAIKGEFWTKANIADASELGNEGFIGAYDGSVALSNFVSWIRASKLAQSIHEEGAVALRGDVNQSFTQSFRERMLAKYANPNDLVEARDLNELRQQVPSSFKVRAGILRRKGENVPRVTRRQLERALDELEAGQAIRDAEDARPATESVPALRPDQLEKRIEVAKAFKLRQDTVNRLLDTPPEELAGPVPGDVAKVLRDVYRMTDRDIREHPDRAWAKASSWWVNAYQSAVNRGAALDALDRFQKVVEARVSDRNEAGVDAAAFDAIRRTYTHPYVREERTGPMADAIAAERDLMLSAFTDQMSAYLENPARTFRAAPDHNGIMVVEVPDFRSTDVQLIDSLVGQLDASQPPELLARAQDPMAHPLEKVDALREALTNQPDLGSAVQRARLAELPTLEGAYTTPITDVLGEGTPVDRASVTQFTRAVMSAEAAYTELRDQARSLAGIVDRSPTKFLTAEVRAFMDRAQVLGGTKIGVGPHGAEMPTWRSLPIDPVAAVTAADEVGRANAISVAAAKLEAAQGKLRDVEERARRATLTADMREVVLEDAPLEKFATRKAAREAAQLARADGNPYGVYKVGSRWGLFRGQWRERPGAEKVTSVETTDLGDGRTLKRTVAVSGRDRIVTIDVGGQVHRYRVSPSRMLDRLGVDTTTLAPAFDEGVLRDASAIEDALVAGEQPKLRVAPPHDPANPTVGEAIDTWVEERTAPEAAQSTATAGTPEVPPAPQPTGFRPAPDIHPQAEYVPVSLLKQFIEIDRTQTPKFRGEEPGPILDQLAQDMVENGQQEAVIIEYDPATHTAMISDGNHRIQAAERAGMTELAARVTVDQWRTKPEHAGTPPPQEQFRPVRGMEPDEHGYLPADAKPSDILDQPEAPAPRTLAEITGVAEPKFTAAEYLKEWTQMRDAARRELADPNTNPARRKFLEETAAREEANLADLERLAREEAPQPAQEAPSAPEPAPVAPEPTGPGGVPRNPEDAARQQADALYQGWLEARKRYDAVGTKARESEAGRATMDAASKDMRAAEGQINQALAEVPLPDHPMTPNEIDPRLAKTSEYTSGGPDVWASNKARIRVTPEADRPTFIFSFDSIQRVAGWTPDGDPLVHRWSIVDPGDARGEPAPLTTGWRPVSAADWERFSQGYGKTYDLYREWAREWEQEAGIAPIVEQITEAQRVREAQVEQLRREATAQEAAYTERAQAYQQGRRLPGGQQPEGELEAALRALDPTDQVGYDALVERYGLEEVSAAENRIELADAEAADAAATAAEAQAAAAKPLTRNETDAFAGRMRERIDATELAEKRLREELVGNAEAPINAARAAGTWDPSLPEHAAMLERLKAAKEEFQSRRADIFAIRTVLEGINHGWSTGRWDAQLVATFARMTDEELNAVIGRIVAEHENGVTIGNVSEWGNKHFWELTGIPEPGKTESPGSALPPAAPTEVTFLDPADNKTPIRSRVVLVDANQLTTSADPGFPTELQPRARGIRASSDEQVQSYAQDIQPDKLTGTTEGATGMPVVNEGGAVVAGNGRTMALRIASPLEFGKYRARIQAEALKYGYSVEDVNALERPMLVRELVDVAPDVQERLAWQLNEMPIGDLAPSFAAAIQPEDLRQFKVGDEQTLADAVRAPGNTTAVARMIGRLPRDWHARYFDPKTGLNEPGAKLLEAALISKLLRADDRLRPGFEAARSVVFQMTEQGSEDIRRIGNGLAEATAQMVKAYERAESGAIGPDILTFGEDLGPALARIIELRDEGLSMEGVQRALQNVTAFSPLTPIQQHLAELLVRSTTQKEVRTFVRAVAEAATETPAVGQELMFSNVAAVDYTGLLNQGVKAWNRLKGATLDELQQMPETPAVRDAIAKARAQQIDYFPSTEAPYDVPLQAQAVTENAIGQTQGPARMTQPLAAEEVQPEIDSRTIGRDVVETSGEPILDAIDEAAEADFDGFAAEVRDLVDTYRAMGRGREGDGFTQAELDFFDALLQGANDGTASPAELHVLESIAGSDIRRNAAGKLNMRPMWEGLRAADAAERGLEGLQIRFKPTAEQAAYKADLEARVQKGNEELRARLADAQKRARSKNEETRRTAESEVESLSREVARIDAEAQARQTTVIRPRPQRAVSREELAADVGPEVPHDAPVPAVDAAVAAGQHTLVVGENPTVNRAVRRAVDAPRVEDPNRRVYELFAPDAAEQAAALEQARLEASAAVQKAEADLAGAQDAPAPERTTASVFPDATLRDQWDRLMRGSDVDQLAAALGSTEPTSLAQVMDAIQSIDKGVYADPKTGVGLTPEEAMNLRTHLMRIANGTLENAIERRHGRRAARATAKLGKPPDDFDAAELQDRAAQIMDEAGQFVVTDPNAPQLEGWLGAQYVLAKPPTKEKGTQLALSPRLLFTDRFAGDVLPTLMEELEVGRMEDVPRRIRNARLWNLLDTAFGPRPEHTIRRQAIANFTAELSKYIDPLAEPQAQRELVKTVETAFGKWRDIVEQEKVGRFQRYRRVHLIGDERLDKLFMDAVSEVYGERRPGWLTTMELNGKRPSQLWRRADNRLRQYISQSGLPLSRRLEAMYGKVADLGTGPATWLTVTYHSFRFLMDLRWIGLETVEPMLLTLPRGGAGPVLEASFLRKTPGLLRATDRSGFTRSGQEPLAFGVDAQRLRFREYAHWATVSDMEQATAVRQRYMVRELMREQSRPFRDVMHDMMEREPQLRRLVDEADGGDVNAFMRRLERDWQLAEQGDRLFKDTKESAAFFKRWLDDGVIDEATYKEFVAAKRYTAHPAIEAELAKYVNDPLMRSVFERLAAINQDLMHQLEATFFGQENRSNVQRLANHPLLFWPISYQIKATKWLMKQMLDEFGGVDTGAAPAGAFQAVHDEHRRRFATDERYKANYTANKTLYFLAGMLFPIIPTELGVSMSPYTRMALYPDYERANGIFGVGPIYTNLTLVPRLIAEQTKPGELGANLPEGVQNALKRAFPQTITVGSPVGKATSETTAEDQRVAPPVFRPIPETPLTTTREPY